jgi:hypothetical protein
MHKIWISVVIAVVAFNLVGRTLVQAIFTAANISATA